MGFRSHRCPDSLPAANIIGKAPRPMCFLGDEPWQGWKAPSGHTPLSLLCPLHCSTWHCLMLLLPPSHPPGAPDLWEVPPGAPSEHHQAQGTGIVTLMFNMGFGGPALFYVAPILCVEGTR